MATHSPRKTSDEDDRRPARPRRVWVSPRIQDFGSTRHLVRGATGPLGDFGTPVGKRKP